MWFPFVFVLYFVSFCIRFVFRSFCIPFVLTSSNGGTQSGVGGGGGEWRGYGVAFSKLTVTHKGWETTNSSFNSLLPVAQRLENKHVDLINYQIIVSKNERSVDTKTR